MVTPIVASLEAQGYGLNELVSVLSQKVRWKFSGSVTVVLEKILKDFFQ
jgi:hypothetical protein